MLSSVGRWTLRDMDAVEAFCQHISHEKQQQSFSAESRSGSEHVFVFVHEHIQALFDMSLMGFVFGP